MVGGGIYPIDESFLLMEAIHAGIVKADEPVPEMRMICRIRFWLSTKLALKVRELSELKGTSQQNLMRSYLFQYLAHPSWKNAGSDQASPEEQ